MNILYIYIYTNKYIYQWRKLRKHGQIWRQFNATFVVQKNNLWFLNMPSFIFFPPHSLPRPNFSLLFLFPLPLSPFSLFPPQGTILSTNNTHYCAYCEYQYMYVFISFYFSIILSSYFSILLCNKFSPHNGKVSLIMCY